MADKILSQEEIDALLNAMDSGEVSVEEEPEESSKSEVKSYDLTAQSLMLRDQFDALDEVYDKFINLLNVSLASSLQHPIEVARPGGGQLLEFLGDDQGRALGVRSLTLPGHGLGPGGLGGRRAPTVGGSLAIRRLRARARFPAPPRAHRRIAETCRSPDSRCRRG